MTPTELKSELESRGLPIPDGHANSKAWREAAIAALEASDEPAAETEPVSAESQAWEVTPEPQPPFTLDAPGPTADRLPGILDESVATASGLKTMAEKLKTHIAGLPHGNEYVQATAYLERAEQHAQLLTDDLVMACDAVKIGQQRAEQVRLSNMDRQRQRKQTYRVRATIRNADVDPEEGDPEHSQCPAKTWPSREAAIAAWREGGSEYRRIMGSVSHPEQLSIVKLVLIDGDGVEEEAA